MSLIGRSPSVQRQHRPDYQIVMYMGLLMLLGLIVIYAISPQQAMVKNNVYGGDYASTYFFVKQLVSLLLAVGVFAVMTKVPYQWVQKYALKILLVGIGASVVLTVSGWLGLPIAQCSLGACRWFVVPSLGTFQPAELLKFGVLVFGAAFLASRIATRQINDLEKTIVPFGVMLAVTGVLVIVFQKDLGTGLSLSAIAGAMLLVAGLSMRWVGILLGIGVLMAIIFIVIAPHRMERVATFLAWDSHDSALDEGYHIKNAKIAIGSGGLTGLGIGNSVQATGYLPEAINDSVFAIMGETFGFIGLVVILALFSGLLLRLLNMVDYLADPWMRLVVTGVFGWLAAHVFLNVAAMIGVAPLTGITLPLLSFGGTSMIFIAGALGLAFQISKYTSHSIVDLKEEHRHENPSSWRGIGRTRYASRRSRTRA